ncbi:MAG TPA: carbohydrate ABC transporter permease [Trueperaceae bacterium]|jgi:multiple sugar transport system permease protein
MAAGLARRDPFLRDPSHPVKPTPAGAVAILVTLVVLSLAALVPLYWMFATSLTPSAMTVRFPPELVPSDLTLDNYRAVLRQPNFWRWVQNSLVQSLAVTAVVVTTASMAGYALAKLPFPGSRALFWLFIVSMMLPFEAILVPLFLVVTRLGLVDTYLGLLLPLMAAPFSIFLMKQFIQTLPSELIDAARVDGASEPRIYWDVVLPLVRPGLAFLGIITFVAQWNSFVWPLVVTRSSEMRTLQVGLVLIREQEPLFFGLQMAAAMMAAIPVIVVFFAFQRYFLRGVTVGALKG